MKRTGIAAVLVVAGAIACGCETHHRLAAPEVSMGRMGLINDPKQVTRLEKALTDGDIAELLDVEVRAKLPTKLALAKLTASYHGGAPDLVQISSEELKQWEETVGSQRHITGVQPISPLAVDVGSDRHRHIPTLHSLRVASAKMNCELLLVYVQGDSGVNNFNDAAALYWTFVGLWLVPGNVLEHQTVVQGIVVDCRTGVILGTATGDSHLKEATAAAFVEIARDKLREQAPKEAAADFQKGTGRLLADIVLEAVRKGA